MIYRKHGVEGGYVFDSKNTPPETITNRLNYLVTQPKWWSDVKSLPIITYSLIKNPYRGLNMVENF